MRILRFVQNDTTRNLPHRINPVFAATLICLAAFAVIALLSDGVFEHLPHSEDEAAYLFQAKVFAQNHLTIPTPVLRQAFWSPFVVDYQGQRFGKYPPGWPFLLSLGVRLDAPWLVNATLAAITLALIAWLGYCFYNGGCLSLRGRRPKQSPFPGRGTASPAARSDMTVIFRRNTGFLSSRAIGLWAAGLGLVTPGFLFLSSSLLSHTASLFWATMALIGLFYLTEKRGTWGVPRLLHASRITHQSRRPPGGASPIFALLTGATLGAAFITRPFAGVGIGLACGIFLLVLIRRGEIKATVLFWLVAGGLPVAALSPLYWWTITGDPTFNAYLLIWPYDRLGFGPDIGPHGYSMANAVFINTRLKLTTLVTGLFGWPGWTNLLFLPIPFLARRANRWDWLLLTTILSLIFVHVFYWAFGGTDGGFPRYYYDALPAFLLLTVRGIQIAEDLLTQSEDEKPSPRRWRPTPLPERGWARGWLRWLPIFVAILFTAYNLVWTLPPLLMAQKGKYGITAVPLKVVEHAGLSEPALVIVKNVEQWNDFAAPFAANSPTLAGPIIYASDEGPEMTQNLREQFKDRVCWELEGKKLKRCEEVDGRQ